MKRTLYFDASRKRVASHATRTTAGGDVIVNVAFGILSAHVATRILAFVLDTSFVGRTVGA